MSTWLVVAVLVALGFSRHGLAMGAPIRNMALASTLAALGLSVVGLSVVGLSVSGCGGKVVFEEDGASNRPGGSGRPGDGPGGGRRPGNGGSARCASPSCSEEVCPPTLPLEGDGCDDDVDCSYPVTCGDALAFCDGFQWHVDIPICPSSTCLEVPTAEQCMQTGGCEWLVPGCGEPALPAAGCQSTVDCTEATCPFDWTCELVVVNPCTVDPCGMCFAERLACVPPIDG